MTYQNLPIEILNIIFSYVPRSPIVALLKPEINNYLILDDYDSDFYDDDDDDDNNDDDKKNNFKEYILKNNFLHRLDKYYNFRDLSNIKDNMERMVKFYFIYDLNQIYGRRNEPYIKIYLEWINRRITQSKINENRLLPKILYTYLSNDELKLIKCKSEQHSCAKIINTEINELKYKNNYAYKSIITPDGKYESVKYRLKTFSESFFNKNYHSTNYEALETFYNPLLSLETKEKRRFERYCKEFYLNIEPHPVSLLLNPHINQWKQYLINNYLIPDFFDFYFNM
jgi:hypothetical protein